MKRVHPRPTGFVPKAPVYEIVCPQFIASKVRGFSAARGIILSDYPLVGFNHCFHVQGFLDLKDERLCCRGIEVRLMREEG